MAVLAAGQLVTPSAYLGSVQQALPKFGIVQSAVAGPPPTAVIVDWSDGTQTTYDAVNDGAETVLLQVGSGGAPIGGSIVQINQFPNPGGRGQGEVVEQFGLTDPSGTVLGNFVVVKTETGYVIALQSNVSIVPSA